MYLTVRCQGPLRRDESRSCRQFTVDPGDGSQPPSLTTRAAHNIGIVVATKNDLVVFLVQNVQGHYFLLLAAEIERLGELSMNQSSGL